MVAYDMKLVSLKICIQSVNELPNARATEARIYHYDYSSLTFLVGVKRARVS